MLCGKSQISSEGGRRAPEKLTYFDNFAMLLKIKGYVCTYFGRSFPLIIVAIEDNFALGSQNSLPSY